MVLELKIAHKMPYSYGQKLRELFLCSAGDPDPHVLGLPDPDPLVRGTDPDPAPEPDLPFSHKVVERTEIMLAK
jgi:hypothetical protein